jgi:hypothetical protein
MRATVRLASRPDATPLRRQSLHLRYTGEDVIFFPLALRAGIEIGRVLCHFGLQRFFLVFLRTCGPFERFEKTDQVGRLKQDQSLIFSFTTGLYAE